MNTRSSAQLASLAATAAVSAQSVSAAENSSVDDLIAKITDKNDQVRGPAWQQAGPYGASAVPSLAKITADPDRETARAATRALWQIVRYAGRPGATKEAQAVVTELIPLLSAANRKLAREALWMLSEIGGDEAVAPMAALLADEELCEDARLTLQRVPGDKSLKALQDGLAKAPEEFKYHLAQSLRARGKKVDGYPSKKLVPVKQTNVKAI